MSEITLLLRCTLTSVENDWQHGTIEVGMGTPEARELLARFADQQPIMLNGRTFLVDSYESSAYETSGPPAGWQPEPAPEWTSSTVLLTVPAGHGGLYMLGDGTLRRLEDGDTVGG
jgi:hypothetical protein